MTGRGTYTYASENPEMGIFLTGKQMKYKMRLEIFTIVLIFLIFLFSDFWNAENFGIQNTPKLYE